jgi:hypothetical protein
MARFAITLTSACLAAISVAGAARAQTQATCTDWLATEPQPAGLAALTGPGVAQRNAMLAAGGKIVKIDSRYYTVSIPAAFYSASRPVLVVDLHGTGGYPEAEWNDWYSSMSAQGNAFIGLSWGGGTPTAATDTDIYRQIKQIVADVGTACPIAGASKWLLGFSVGSAMSFAVLIRDVADARLFRGQLAVSGSAIAPLTTGRDVMHPTVEANRSNVNAMLGLRSWMYCGQNDMDHGWSMCDEMPGAESFVDQHGGDTQLYRDATGTHHSLPGNTAGKASMFDFVKATGPSVWLSDVQTDCLLSWGETAYAGSLWPAGATSQVMPPYRYRYYTGSQVYVGVSSIDARLYALAPPLVCVRIAARRSTPGWAARRR